MNWFDDALRYEYIRLINDIHEKTRNASFAEKQLAIYLYTLLQSEQLDQFQKKLRDLGQSKNENPSYKAIRKTIRTIDNLEKLNISIQKAEKLLNQAQEPDQELLDQLSDIYSEITETTNQQDRVHPFTTMEEWISYEYARLFKKINDLTLDAKPASFIDTLKKRFGWELHSFQTLDGEVNEWTGYDPSDSDSNKLKKLMLDDFIYQMIMAAQSTVPRQTGPRYALVEWINDQEVDALSTQLDKIKSDRDFNHLPVFNAKGILTTLKETDEHILRSLLIKRNQYAKNAKEKTILEKLSFDEFCNQYKPPQPTIEIAPSEIKAEPVQTKPKSILLRLLDTIKYYAVETISFVVYIAIGAAMGALYGAPFLGWGAIPGAFVGAAMGVAAWVGGYSIAKIVSYFSNRNHPVISNVAPPKKTPPPPVQPSQEKTLIISKELNIDPKTLLQEKTEQQSLTSSDHKKQKPTTSMPENTNSETNSPSR